MQAITKTVHENLHVIGFYIQQIDRPGTIQVSQQNPRRIERRVTERQVGEHKTFTEAPASQVWPAGDLVMANTDQMLLTTAQHITERDQFAG